MICVAIFCPEAGSKSAQYLVFVITGISNARDLAPFPAIVANKDGIRVTTLLHPRVRRGLAACDCICYVGWRSVDNITAFKNLPNWAADVDWVGTVRNVHGGGMVVNMSEDWLNWVISGKLVMCVRLAYGRQ